MPASEASCTPKGLSFPLASQKSLLPLRLHACLGYEVAEGALRSGDIAHVPIRCFRSKVRKEARPGQKGAVRDPPLGKAQQGALAARCPGHAWHTRHAEKNGHEGGRTISGRRNRASALPGLTALGGSATRRSLCSSLATYPCLSGLHIIHTALIKSLCGRCRASTCLNSARRQRNQAQPLLLPGNIPMPLMNCTSSMLRSLKLCVGLHSFHLLPSHMHLAACCSCVRQVHSEMLGRWCGWLLALEQCVANSLKPPAYLVPKALVY